MPDLHIVPSFHYDVAYLKSYAEYLPICFRILDEALRIMEEEPEYQFLVEQVILLEEYWNQRPEKRALMRQLAQEGRLSVAPGMFVMPDMNHPAGETMFLQAKLGKRWLKENLGLDPTVCWIADCWGHHAQLPQILRQCGYEYYVFWRCMRREVQRNDFIWQGLDGTQILTHWLARGYGNITFPTQEEVINAPDLDLTGCGPKQIEGICGILQQYGQGDDPLLLCNGGDFMYPQSSAVGMLHRLREHLPAIRFSTPEKFLAAVRWNSKPVVTGEFNSAFQGTFTSNIRIKQFNRRLTGRMLALEALAVATGRKKDYTELWRPVLKQQFHDIICGTITDAALDDCLDEYEAAEKAIDAEQAGYDDSECELRAFNPLSFPQSVWIHLGGNRFDAELPPMGFARLSNPKPEAVWQDVTLPFEFENDFYRARINENGCIDSLIEKSSQRQIVRPHASPFGGLSMQIDNGDLWLNFESPLSGVSVESSLTQNAPDPYDRMTPGSIINSTTFGAKIARVMAAKVSDEGVMIVQQGTVSFWQLNISFITGILFSRRSPRIEYETTLTPHGKHCRLRAAFPTNIVDGTIRHEIPFGIQQRESGEHLAQNWIDYADPACGLALLNQGTAASNVHDGVMMLTLFRSAAMEYKAPSEKSFAEGVTHCVKYAIVPHGADADVQIIREGQAFNSPPLTGRYPATEGIFAVDAPNVFISGLRHSEHGTFLRIYEATGKPARGTLSIPSRFCQCADADGIERPVSSWRDCSGSIAFELRPFEIRGWVLRGE